MVKIERISLTKKGLTKFFSKNEIRIMELLWKRNNITSTEIQKELNDLSLACVAGTLDRLVRSGFVKRKIDDSNNRIKYIYSATGTKQEVGTKISEKVIESLVDTFGESVIDTIGKIKIRRKVTKK
jgi:predicted transcriptional regulator